MSPVAKQVRIPLKKRSQPTQRSPQKAHYGTAISIQQPINLQPLMNDRVYESGPPLNMTDVYTKQHLNQ